jgi:hypothetical protein
MYFHFVTGELFTGWEYSVHCCSLFTLHPGHLVWALPGLAGALIAMAAHDQAEAAREARTDALNSSDAAMQVDSLLALGGETIWLGIGGEEAKPAIKVGDGHAAKISGGVTVRPDALSTDSEGSAIICAADGVVELPSAVELGEEFSFSVWFETPLPPLPAVSKASDAPEAAPEFAIVFSGVTAEPHGPRFGGVGFKGKELGVMVMGQFDGCDLDTSMLGDGWHHMCCRHTRQAGAGFVVDGIDCGSSRAPLGSSVAAVGNLPPGAGVHALGYGCGYPLADVRFFGGKILSDAECATLLDQVDSAKRGSGPDPSLLEEAQVAKLMKQMSAVDAFVARVSHNG